MTHTVYDSYIVLATRDLYQPSNYEACELVISSLMKYSNLKISGNDVITLGPMTSLPMTN
jgi:hypothetical protein